ncbi:MAG: Tetratricopeptide repeat protein [Bacteroidetes bacterium ADurb.Bin408]|nr:MAG: Tetratricopeptide repeat protein [Bacteroidetes bacterium ADurb.Bin408]
MKFKKRFREIKESHAALSASVNKVMTNIDEVYFNQGYTYFLKNNYDKAAEYFERSIRSNPGYTRSHYRLGEVLFIKGDIDKSSEIILNLVLNMKMEKDIEANVLALAQQIMLDYIERGKAKIKNEEFHQAIKEFEKADLFCKKARVIACSPNINKGIIEAKAGLYNSYLIIASKALENDKINLAAKFIYDARAFLSSNPDLIVERIENDTAINKLIDKLIAQGIVQFQNKEYEKAVDTYNKAFDLCSLCEDKKCQALIAREMKNAKTGLYDNILQIIREHLKNENLVAAENLLLDAERFNKENSVTQNALFETENLWMALNKIKYRNYISQGVEFLKKDSVNTAMDLFLKAKALERGHIAFPDYSLNTYIKTTGKNILMEMLSQAKIKAWGNDLVSAKKLADNINEKTKLFLLESDSEVISISKDLSNRIKEQECVNLSFEINRDMIIAQRYISNADYVSAFELLSDIILRDRKDLSCKLDVAKYNKLLTEIEPFYMVQSDCKAAIEAILKKDFEKADSLVLATEKLFDAHPVLNGKISRCNRYNLLEHISDSTVLLNAASYYLDKDSLMLSITALQQMFRLNLSPVQTISLQKKLAKKLAAYDFKINKNASYSERMVFYKTANPWFSIFSRHYRLKWFKLKIFRK